MNFCSQCGIKLVPSCNVCPNCGNILKPEHINHKKVQPLPPPQIYHQPKPIQQPIDFHPRKGNSNGKIALIFGLLGLIVVVVITGLLIASFFLTIGIIIPNTGLLSMCTITGSILGIVFGAIGRKKDVDGRMATAGFVLGIIGIIMWIIFFAWLFFSIFWAFRFGPVYPD